MSRTAQPLDRKREDRLLEAAATAFTAEGYQHASLNQIIAKAGWAKSSFYHYFPDKQRLHDHVVLTLRRRLEAGIARPDIDSLTVETYWPGMGILLETVDRTLTEHPETQLLLRMFRHPLAARGPEGQLTRLRQEVADWLALAVGHGKTVGAVRDDLPSDLLTDLAMAILATIEQWNLNPERDDNGVHSSSSLALIRDTLARRA